MTASISLLPTGPSKGELVQKVLEYASDMNLEVCLVVGKNEEGQTIFIGDGSSIEMKIALLEICKLALIQETRI